MGEHHATIFHVVEGPVPGEGSIGPRDAHSSCRFDPENNNSSIYNCITRARENARGIRELISSEMWENLNTLYWSHTRRRRRGQQI